MVGDYLGMKLGSDESTYESTEKLRKMKTK